MPIILTTLPKLLLDKCTKFFVLHVLHFMFQSDFKSCSYSMSVCTWQKKNANCSNIIMMGKLKMICGKIIFSVSSHLCLYIVTKLSDIIVIMNIFLPIIISYLIHGSLPFCIVAYLKLIWMNYCTVLILNH